MPKRQNNFRESPIFQPIFSWDLEKLLSLIVFFFCLIAEIYLASPKTLRNVLGAVLVIIYMSVFPLLWIWFAEYLEDFLVEFAWLERIGISIQSVIRFLGWLALFAILVFAIIRIWTAEY